ncbi:MAG: hypothetical protein IJS86_06255 [Lachnospiraceae bacterium]|nr:hypothetical protein [Lachnospiraceae bacterium]
MNRSEDTEHNKYADIINMDRPVSKTRPHMSMRDRAAQFAPFAALTGLEEELEETAAKWEEGFR